MTWPNLITLARLFSVPLILWLILKEESVWAFYLTLLAGISDVLDGLLARTLKVYSVLGSYLDPFADKVLLMGIYWALCWKGYIPLALVFLVIFRDILILGGVLFLWGTKKSVTINPLFISKVNTFFQIVTAATVLAQQAFHSFPLFVLNTLFLMTAMTTLISALGYIMILKKNIDADS